LIAEGVARQQQPAKAKRSTRTPVIAVIKYVAAAHGTMAEADPLLDVLKLVAPLACLLFATIRCNNPI
jgi:hypothetical protein